MIQSFADKATKAIFEGRRVRQFDAQIQRRAYIILNALEQAQQLSDLAVPPSNRLHPLRGKLAGMHSVSVNRQYRIAFRWTPTGPENVSLTRHYND